MAFPNPFPRCKRRANNQGPPTNPNQPQATGILEQSQVPQASSATTPDPSSANHQATSPGATLTSATPSGASQNAGRVGWAGLKKLLGVLNKNAGVLGPLKSVVDELVELIDVYARAGEGSAEYETLQNELEGLCDDLSQHFSGPVSPTMTTSMKNLCHGIKKELEQVKSDQVKRRKGPGGRLVAECNYDQVLACYGRIQVFLQRLKINADLSMWRMIDERTANALLDRLAPVLPSRYDSAQSSALLRGRCTDGTRVDVLAHMGNWVGTSPAGAVYWLNGMAGTGKTTIAYSLCEGLDAEHMLGASFFCSRLLPDCRDVNRIVPSIAYQLARYSRPFRYALLEVLENDPDVHQRLLRIQFERLIVQPLDRVRVSLPTDLVVVIDALDECDDKRCTSRILDLLLTKSWTLPIKILVCSRPEPQIRDEMTLQGGLRASERLVLHELDKGIVQADIGMYLRGALSPMQPSEQDLNGLVERAGVLFIYAATAVRYIGYDNFRRNPHARLQAILSMSREEESNKHKEIDELYSMILDAAINDSGLERREKADRSLVLNTVVCAREPLTISALSGLLKLHDTERVHTALRPLWSVLHVMEISELVTTLHASFPDYMFDPKRSNDYHCDQRIHNGTLASHCFDCIENVRPQFNICGLKTSCQRDSQLTNLDDRVKQAVSIELFYACRYWGIHLSVAESSSDLVNQLYEFLSQRLLLWMEVLNLKRCIHAGVDIMWQAEEWTISHNCPEDTIELAHDAWRYTMTFASSPVSQSTPHIYISMLPFWPRSAPIARYYSNCMRGMVLPQGTAMERRRLAVLASWKFDGQVQSAAFSPDGTQIALAAGMKVHLLNAFTGQAVIEPFAGHTQNITSTDFSPDGARIASGSEDKTIRLWDVQSKRLVIDPLRGHTRRVTCIRFSPDGTRIISGSNDQTIRMWDTRNGQMIGSFEGHTSCITAVDFSHDGTRIVSGSVDKTMRVWNAQSRQVLLVIKGHKSRVTSVNFSPDGESIVSASYDKTIHLWNAHNGTRVDASFRGHTGRVTSVVFSSDGRCIASGSEDKTIRLWDPRTGTTMLGPLELHTSSINSVAFSVQGSYLVSTSNDWSVTLWDARSKETSIATHESQAGSVQLTSPPPSNDYPRATSSSCDNTRSVRDKEVGQEVLGPLEGHTDSVRAVGFSPDGTRIVSGSYDKTIRVWDVRSGYTVLGPLKGHTHSVVSVGFSPDGTRIVSGSGDKTIRVWDMRSGQTVLGPLEGHTSSVQSVGFSPDGTRIVSGSGTGDKTIRVWDMRSGQTVLGPLEGHTQSVVSVGFSPDGTRIVSGSHDQTIRVWDIQTGQTVLGPLEGHTGPVISVGFSPDGTRVVSGSYDKTIRVWDMRNGQMVLGPLRGHTDLVFSVGFSPDGTRIVSGSSDNTIRMWDVQSGQTVLGPLRGHTGLVFSVRFSPDGTLIVSGSIDNTICVWDVQSNHLCNTLHSLQESNPMSPVPSNTFLQWSMQEDGWIVDDNNELLLCAPCDLRKALMPARIAHQLPRPRNGQLRLNFEGALLGEAWSLCYQPQ